MLWIKKNSFQQVANYNLTYKRLFLMWALMVLGYWLFVVQWYSISRFSPGYNATFGTMLQNNILANSATNWTITFGRAIGSILAGYFIARFGHKYAVVFVLSLMVLSFPYLIVAQNAAWNQLKSLDGKQIAVTGFSLFVLFRIFLGIGGTTLISYTNSVIAKMPADKRAKHITLNSLGFNTAAFFANIFFVANIPSSFIANPAFWVTVLALLMVITFVILILYLLYGIEVIPKIQKEKFAVAANNQQFGFKDALKRKDLYAFFVFYGMGIVAVIFSNSSAFRSFINSSKANNASAIGYNQPFAWVWPTFICVFVSSYFVSMLTVTKVTKTIFHRKAYLFLLYSIGLFFMALMVLVGYFGGLTNPLVIFFFLFFAFVGGVFIWGSQPIVLTIPQQEEISNPRYVGVVFGLIWGFGYLFYTISDASLSSIINYVGVIDPNKRVLTSGSIIMIVLFWLLMLLALLMILFLPNSGFVKNNSFIYYKLVFNPFNKKHWKWSNYLIANY